MKSTRSLRDFINRFHAENPDDSVDEWFDPDFLQKQGFDPTEWQEAQALEDLYDMEMLQARREGFRPEEYQALTKIRSDSLHEMLNQDLIGKDDYLKYRKLIESQGQMANPDFWHKMNSNQPVTPKQEQGYSVPKVASTSKLGSLDTAKQQANVDRRLKALDTIESEPKANTTMRYTGYDVLNVLPDGRKVIRLK